MWKTARVGVMILGVVGLLEPACGGEVLDGPIYYSSSYSEGGTGDGTGDADNSTYEHCLDYFSAVNSCYSGAGFSDYYPPDQQCAPWDGVVSDAETTWFACMADLYWNTDCAWGFPNPDDCQWAVR